MDSITLNDRSLTKDQDFEDFCVGGLRWVDDDVYLPLMRKDYKIVLSVDIAEGLGQDYSIINILSINLDQPLNSQSNTYYSFVSLILWRTKNNSLGCRSRFC